MVTLMAEVWRGKIACMDKKFIDKQWQHCYAEEAISDSGEITIWALGGFVPEDDEEAAAGQLTQENRFKPSYAPPGRKVRMASQVKQENEYRLALVVKMNDFIRVLEETGCTVKKASKVSGLNRRQAETLRVRVSAFAARWKDVYDDVTDELEEAGLKRAIHGVEKTIYYQGIGCGKETVYSDSLLSMMLQSRKPDVYKNRVGVDQKVSGDPDNPLVHEHSHRNLSREEIIAELEKRGLPTTLYKDK